jgi:mono/diheme cytochrome c family protein
MAVLTTMFVLAAGAGCRQEMYNQPKYKNLRESDFFPDRRQARPLPDGTIPRGFLRADTRLYQGRTGNALTTEFPLKVDDALLARGRERYNIYCSPCHDRTGYGGGMVVRRGYRPPPSFHIDRLRDAPVGHFFDVITRGFGAMPDYAAQIPVNDRWAIIAYVRALQLSQNAPLSQVPADEREKLQAMPGSPAPPTPTPAPAPFPIPGSPKVPLR